MAPEVGAWLANVRDRDPAAADLIDEAVAALRAGGETGRGGLAEQAGERRRAAEERLAEMRRLHTGMQAEEERLTMASFRLQDKVSAFRTRIEALKTAWATAEAAAEAAWAAAVIDDASADVEGASPAPAGARDAGSARPSPVIAGAQRTAAGCTRVVRYPHPVHRRATGHGRASRRGHGR
jgi:hypothetical protein